VTSHDVIHYASYTLQMSTSSAHADKPARRACGSVKVIESGTVRQLHRPTFGPWGWAAARSTHGFVTDLHRYPHCDLRQKPSYGTVISRDVITSRIYMYIINVKLI